MAPRRATSGRSRGHYGPRGLERWPFEGPGPPVVYGALTQAPLGSHELQLIVGLPLGLAVGEHGRESVAAVKSWLTGYHHWDVLNPPSSYVARGTGVGDHTIDVTVTTVGCVSQAHAAYTDWIVALDGAPQHKPGKAAEIGVISVGFNTIELLVLRDNAPIARFTAGEKLGVRRLLEIVNEQRGGLFTLGELDSQLRAT